MVTLLGMPPIPPGTAAPPWRAAWDSALYGPDGFYRRQAPADHFRTSVHGSDLTARALLRLVRAHGLDTVVDVGAGRGELLTHLHDLAPDLDLLGVEVASRPPGLPAPVAWSARLPDSVEGLLVAHEWLDNIPCHVVEVDASGVVRLVHVDPATGEETHGHPARAHGVPPSLPEWLERWWPLDGEGPGARAEIGSTRDRAWSDVVGRVTRGLAVAVDYGHTREARPPLGSLRAFRGGRQVRVVPDGSRDVTASVAVDSVVEAARSVPSSTETLLVRQSSALRALGLSSALPPLSWATERPEAYAEALARAGQVGELTSSGGLGDFYWVVSGCGGVLPDLGPAPD